MNTGNGDCKSHGKRTHAARRALLAFLFALAISMFLSSIPIRHKMELQQLSMEQLIAEKSTKISQVISKLVYKTQALAALVIQSNGAIEDFDHVAPALLDDPAILNILAAPNGIVSEVYPLAGNEKLIGYNLFGDGAGNREAALARERNELVFGGPFPLIQGGMGLVGRLPIWLDNGDMDDRLFWGLVSVTLRYPQALVGAGLDRLAREGFFYQIWRYNPDDGLPQVIARSQDKDRTGLPYIEQEIHILNANWYFRIMPVRLWYEFPENWILLGASACMSLLVGLIIYNNEILRNMKWELEDTVRTDALTGILNRVGLFQVMNALLEKKDKFDLYYFDLNQFKQINDNFGHRMGDTVLTEFCHRVGKYLTKNYTLARISGDEFVLLHTPDYNEAKTTEYPFFELLEMEFKDPLFSTDGTPIRISFSKGMATYPEDGTSMDELLACADHRMYQDKQDHYAKTKKRRASDLRLG